MFNVVYRILSWMKKFMGLLVIVAMWTAPGVGIYRLTAVQLAPDVSNMHVVRLTICFVYLLVCRTLRNIIHLKTKRFLRNVFRLISLQKELIKLEDGKCMNNYL